MDEPTKTRFYTPTPGRLVLGLIIIELLLLLIKPTSGWMVLTGIAIFILTILGGLVWFVVALVWRKRFQFSILSLIGLMLCVAILGSWFTWKMERARRQAAAVERLRKMGDGVLYDYQYDFLPENGRIPDWERPPTPPTLPRLVVGDDFFADVVYIQITSTVFDNGDLEQLRGLQELAHLQHLYLVGPPLIGDDGLKRLSGLTSLKVLDLTNTNVADEDIKELQQALPNCEIIHAMSTTSPTTPTPSNPDKPK